MFKITRDPRAADQAQYDIIIIGGGIYGAMVCLEASIRGLKALLLERDDFGEHTSYNSLRIIHGGLRYLQKLDLKRFHESVQERRWFLKNFPGLVMPIACMMPLYGIGLKRPWIFRIALMINHFLSRKCNTNMAPDQILDSGGVITPEEVQEIFPKVDRTNLLGGAIWYDACMPDSQRILMQALLWACNAGATALNYTKALSLITVKNNVAGIKAQDKETGEEYEFGAKVVVNAAGPWCREVATKFDKDDSSLFQPSLAWNVLFDRKSLSSHALALTPKKPDSQTLFLVPWKGRVMAGTGHLPWKGGARRTEPSDEQLKAFIKDINTAIPDLDLAYKDIVRVYAGLLPAKKESCADLSVREVILDHSKKEGPNGLYSISGVKFTTSRLVAQKILKHIYPSMGELPEKSESHLSPLNKKESKIGIFDYDWLPNDEDDNWKQQLKSIVDNESVLHIDDLIFRRTSFADNPYRTKSFVQALLPLFNWNEERFKNEVSRLSD